MVNQANNTKKYTRTPGRKRGKPRSNALVRSAMIWMKDGIELYDLWYDGEQQPTGFDGLS